MTEEEEDLGGLTRKRRMRRTEEKDFEED